MAEAPKTARVLALTQGDPAGIGPEILVRLAAEPASVRPGGPWRPLLVAERAALEAVPAAAGSPRLRFFERPPHRAELDGLDPETAAVFDPVGRPRPIEPGRSGPADAAGALAALDAGVMLVRAGLADALVTAPVSKASIARHARADFRGHTDYLAAACGLAGYGVDYLMAFLSDELQVALLTTHLPLAAALDAVTPERIVAALELIEGAGGGRIAVAGLNPHAGEGGLMGDDEARRIAPAIEEARRQGLDVAGPESPDSLFARARRGEFDWVLALYHDQGLIAVKTLDFGGAVNWTLGLPFVRTSVDHGTAFELAGQGRADAGPLGRAAAAALALVAGELPRRAAGGAARP